MDESGAKGTRKAEEAGLLGAAPVKSVVTVGSLAAKAAAAAPSATAAASGSRGQGGGTGAEAGGAAAVVAAAAPQPPPLKLTLGAYKGGAVVAKGTVGVAGIDGYLPSPEAWKAMVKLVETLEARIRELEACAFSTGMIAEEAPLIRASKHVLAWYLGEIKGQEKTHKLGSPHLHLAVAGLEALTADEAFNRPIDAPIVVRMVALKLLHFVMCTLEPAVAAGFIMHYRVSDTFTKPGEKTIARVSWAFQGHLTLPNEAEAGAVLAAFRADDEQQLQMMAASCFVIEDDLCYAAGPRAIPLDRVFRTVLCNSGGTMMTGKAPPGGQVRKIGKRAGKST